MKELLLRLLGAILIVLTITLPVRGYGQSVAESAARRSYSPADSAWAKTQIEQLTLKERVAQLFIVWASGYFQNADAPAYRRLVRLVEDVNVGGVIFGRGAPLAQAALTNDLQRHADLPLLVAQDMEWGPGMRLQRSTTYPRAMALGATRDPQLAYDVGYSTAQAARALGVQQVYGPVADVNNNPGNPVINVRSFGEQPDLVADMTAAFVRGAQQGGALATAKHFPGHGDTATDSHIGLPVLHFGRSRLDTLELVPFRSAITAGTRSIMIGHLAIPQIVSDSTVPATLSPAITGGILRKDMGYDGLVVTDAMTMSGVTKNFGVGEAAVRAIEAGADMLLKSESFYAARAAILDAVKEGRLTEERIDHSVMRILLAKKWTDLNERRLVALDDVRKRVGGPSRHALAGEIARSALTLLRNRNDLLPITPPDSPRVLSITLSDSDDPSVGNTFDRYLHRAASTDHLSFARLDVRSDSSDFAAVLQAAAGYDVVLVPAFLRVRTGSGKIRLPAAQQQFLDELIRQDVPVALIALGNPYMASALQHQPAAYLTAYGASKMVQEAVAQAVFGKNPMPGKLPVTIPGAYSYGAGLSRRQVAPRQDLPEAAGMSGRRLDRVDSLLQASITDHAFPGAAVAVGRGPVLSKVDAYGFHTYDAEHPVSTRSRFDLASLTKVIATTTSAMKLYEQGKLKLSDRVVKYLPEFGQNGKGEVTIHQLLTHSAGLQPYLHPETHHLDSRAEIIDSVMAQKLQYEPDAKSEYSGLGLITLQLVIEKITGQTLADYAQTHIFAPLGMDDTGFLPRQEVDSTAFMPTSDGTSVFRGVVHDPMARRMGGVSGNAGLFSTVEDLATFAYMLTHEGRIYGRQFLQKETIDLFTERAGKNTGTRALGWDTKSREGYSSAGQYFGPESFGHTGYTGTSLWIDPEKDLFAILLTNRVYPSGGGNHKISAVRPKFADLVYKAMAGPPRPVLPAMPQHGVRGVSSR